MKSTNIIKTINQQLACYKQNLAKAEEGLAEVEKSCREIDKLIGKGQKNER